MLKLLKARQNVSPGSWLTMVLHEGTIHFYGGKAAKGFLKARAKVEGVKLQTHKDVLAGERYYYLSQTGDKELMNWLLGEVPRRVDQVSWYELSYDFDGLPHLISNEEWIPSRAASTVLYLQAGKEYFLLGESRQLSGITSSLDLTGLHDLHQRTAAGTDKPLAFAGWEAAPYSTATEVGERLYSHEYLVGMPAPFTVNRPVDRAEELRAMGGKFAGSLSTWLRDLKTGRLVVIVNEEKLSAMEECLHAIGVPTKKDEELCTLELDKELGDFEVTNFVRAINSTGTAVSQHYAVEEGDMDRPLRFHQLSSSESAYPFLQFIYDELRCQFHMLGPNSHLSTVRPAFKGLEHVLLVQDRECIQDGEAGVSLEALTLELGLQDAASVAESLTAFTFDQQIYRGEQRPCAEFTSYPFH